MPEFELIWDLNYACPGYQQVERKSDKKKEQASLETLFSHYKSMGNFSRHSRAPNSVGNRPIWLKFELVPRLYACPRYQQAWKKSDEKQQRKGGDTDFPIIS